MTVSYLAHGLEPFGLHFDDHIHSEASVAIPWIESGEPMDPVLDHEVQVAQLTDEDCAGSHQPLAGGEEAMLGHSQALALHAEAFGAMIF